MNDPEAMMVRDMSGCYIGMEVEAGKRWKGYMGWEWSY